MKVKLNKNTEAKVFELEEGQRGLCCLDIDCLSKRKDEKEGDFLCFKCIFHDDYGIFYIDMDKLDIIKEDGE